MFKSVLSGSSPFIETRSVDPLGCTPATTRANKFTTATNIGCILADSTLGICHDVGLSPYTDMTLSMRTIVMLSCCYRTHLLDRLTDILPKDLLILLIEYIPLTPSWVLLLTATRYGAAIALHSTPTTVHL